MKYKINWGFNTVNLAKKVIEVLEVKFVDINIKKIQKRASKSFREYLQSHIRYHTLENIRIDIKQHKEYLLVLKEEAKLGKLFCWHSWIHLYTNFSLGEKFQCKKCQKIKYND